MPLRDTEGRADRCADHPRLGHRGQVDEPATVAPALARLLGDLHREAGLPYPARPGHGHHPMLGDGRRQGSTLLSASHEAGRPRRPAVAACRPRIQDAPRLPGQGPPVGHLRLAHHRGHVTFHGTDRQAQVRRDLGVRQVIGNQREHLAFPLGDRRLAWLVHHHTSMREHRAGGSPRFRRSVLGTDVENDGARHSRRSRTHGPSDRDPRASTTNQGEGR